METSEFDLERIGRLLNGLEGYSEKNVRTEGVAYTVDLFYENKRVTVAWKYELGEVFVDFWKDGRCIFQDWFERLNSDTVDTFVAYVDVVAKRFMFHDTRVKKIGLLFFRRYQLQYRKDKEWLNILHP